MRTANNPEVTLCDVYAACTYICNSFAFSTWLHTRGYKKKQERWRILEGLCYRCYMLHNMLMKPSECMAPSCSTSVMHNKIKNSHKTVEHILIPVEDETDSLCQSYIHIFTAFLQTKSNNHPPGMVSSIIQISHTNICFDSTRIDELLFPEGSF